jgi:hypothetical protein
VDELVKDALAALSLTGSRETSTTVRSEKIVISGTGR